MLPPHGKKVDNGGWLPPPFTLGTEYGPGAQIITMKLLSTSLKIRSMPQLHDVIQE